MKLPELIPLALSTSNPKNIEKYNFDIKLAQLTGTNGPRDLYSAYNIDFFEKYTLAFSRTINSDILIGYDGSRVHQSISKSVKEHLRRGGISVKELDGPVTVPEFMYACSKLGMPGCFYGRSHSPQQYIGLKLVINGQNMLDLLRKNGATINFPKTLKQNKVYGFLARTLAPVIEENIQEIKMINPKEIGNSESISSVEMREYFFKSLKKVVPLKKIKGEFIVDCRHSMAGEVWNLVKAESDIKIKLDNNKLNPTAPDRDPREIWDKLCKKYATKEEAVFDHDADADRTFLVKMPGKGEERIVHNQELSFATGLIAEASKRKVDAYALVQERITLVMLTSLAKLTDKVYATAQGEPAFFMGVNEILKDYPEYKRISGADYTNIFFSREHPICMKSPYQQALWLMYWFTENQNLPEFPEVNLLKTQIDMLDYNYPQRLEKVLGSTEDILGYLKKNFEVKYHSTLDGQNLIMRDDKDNFFVTSIRPSGTGRYTKIISEIGMGSSNEEERLKKVSNVNKEIAKIIGK